jgi:hypothetical protein
MIGLGFALTETAAAYALPLLVEQGLGPGLVNLLWRTVFFGLNHAFWTAIVGTGVAFARLEARSDWRLAAPVLAWTGAVLLHGLHNLGATLAAEVACLPIGLSLFVDWGGMLALGVVIALVLRQERDWIARGLADEVRLGTLSAEEVELLSSAMRRGLMRWQALRRGGLPAFRVVGRYSQHSTELAFRRHRWLQTGSPNLLRQVKQLRADVGLYRGQALRWLQMGDA